MDEVNFTLGISRTYNDWGETMEVKADNYENYVVFVTSQPDHIECSCWHTPRPGDTDICINVRLKS